MSPRRARILRLGIVSLALGAGLLVLRRSLGLEFDPDSLRQAVSGLGVWAPLGYVGIVAFRVPLGLPSQLVLMGGGLVFGTLQGTLFGGLGILVSALLLFTTARWAGREVVEERLPTRMRPVFDLAETRLGALFLAAGTGYPFGPITMYHLISGVTGMAVLGFVIAVSVGGLFRSALFTFFGSQLVSGDLTGIALATFALGAVVVMPLCFRRSRAWFFALGRSSQGPRPEGDQPGSVPRD
jgi:uncharacterized membrane protein YdjX (TVP38/TMEM64 family)